MIKFKLFLFFSALTGFFSSNCMISFFAKQIHDNFFKKNDSKEKKLNELLFCKKTLKTYQNEQNKQTEEVFIKVEGIFRSYLAIKTLSLNKQIERVYANILTKNILSLCSLIDNSPKQVEKILNIIENSHERFIKLAFDKRKNQEYVNFFVNMNKKAK